MKIKSFFKVFASALMLASMATPALAVDTTAATIDTSKTGSITVVKIKEQDGNISAGTALVNGSESRERIGGVVFKVGKVADISNVTNANGGSDTDGAYYVNVNSTLKTYTHQTKQAYTADELMNAVSELCETESGVEKLRAMTTQAVTTDSNGQAVFSNLPLGLYVVAETDNSGAYIDTDGNGYHDDYNSVKVGTPADPYLVSVPMTNIATVNGHEPGTVWQYDITSYPKDTTIYAQKYTKNLDNSEIYSNTEDWEIGKDHEQVIYTDVPVVKKGEYFHPYDKFVIHDVMNNLAFTKINQIILTPSLVKDPDQDADITGTQLTTADYTLAGSEGSSEFTVTLTASGLAKLNALQQSATLAVYFDSYLTPSAEIGTSANNTNQATVTWSTTNTPDSSITTQIIHNYTYGLDLVKDGLNDATKAVFTVDRVGDFTSRATTGRHSGVDTVDSGRMSFIKESDGVYRVARKGEAGAVTEISPASNKHLIIKGFDDNNAYCFTEIATEEGKNLMADSFTIRYTSGSDETGAIQTVTVNNGSTYDANSAVRLSHSNGIASLTVKNAPTVTLRTGGAGLYWAAGIAVVAAVGAVFFKRMSLEKSQN